MNQAVSAGERLAEAALALLGVPFRLNGRDPATGLDCVGLVVASLNAIGRDPISPRGYALRNVSIGQWLCCAHGSGLEPVEGLPVIGDVLLVRPGPAQHHIMIATKGEFAVHAHAGLGMVVRQPISLFPERLAHWRLQN